jgi:hypothetical protein
VATVVIKIGCEVGSGGCKAFALRIRNQNSRYGEFDAVIWSGGQRT